MLIRFIGSLLVFCTWCHIARQVGGSRKSREVSWVSPEMDFEISFCHPQVSVLTTLERRFNLQSADVGVIASSFEIGNLALILFVSYFGARGHRPRLIGCGGIVMALGALLSALPEFLTHQYKYEAGEIHWGAEGRDVCATNGSSSDEGPDPDLICRNRTATNMMYLLLIGAQVLLGIGATPVQPLGVSYIDDHVRRKDSSLYIGRHCRFCMCWYSGAKLGPSFTGSQNWLTISRVLKNIWISKLDPQKFSQA